jgi:hypothetical protein
VGRLLVTILILLLTASSAQAASRIVGGDDVKEENYTKWQNIIALGVTEEHIMDGQFCAAVYLRDRYALTAAHCVRDDTFSYYPNGQGIEAWTKAYDLRRVDYRNRHDVIGVYTHPHYAFKKKIYDVALIEFDHIPDMPPLSIAPVQIESQPALIAGWGFASRYRLPYKLQEAAVPIQNDSICKGSDIGPDYDLNTMLCAGYPEGGIDSCSGDSGGPILSEDGMLLGLVSWGYGCALPGSYGVYTRLSNPEIVSWIDRRIAGESVEKPTMRIKTINGPGRLQLTWDSSGGKAFRIAREQDDGSLYILPGSLKRNWYRFDKVKPEETYSFRVAPEADDGTTLGWSKLVQYEAPADRSRPSRVNKVWFQSAREGSGVIRWSRSVDNYHIDGYSVERKTAKGWRRQDILLQRRLRVSAGCYRVRARDISGYYSKPSMSKCLPAS